VKVAHRALSARRIHPPPRGNFRLLLPRAGDCIFRSRALDPACFAAGIEAGGREEGLRGQTWSMAEEQIEEASMAIAGRGAWRRSRSKRRPWPRRRSRRSSSSSTSPSRSRSNLHSPPLPLPSAYANAVVQVHVVLILNQHLLRLQNSVLQNSLTCF
jgi:hypothetical protein